MRVIFFNIILLSSIWSISGCSSINTVLDDISRDTYESIRKKAHRIDNLGNPTPIVQENPGYDQCQRERFHQRGCWTQCISMDLNSMDVENAVASHPQFCLTQRHKEKRRC